MVYIDFIPPTDVSKIDENSCKQTLASLPRFGAYR